MRFVDLLRMSINNLRRRKLRTGLTVLGVVIGTASIMVMVSLGIGLKEITMEQYASYGSLTKIEVYRNYGGNTENQEDTFITDKVVEKFSEIPHVKAVSPCLNVYVDMKQGVYETSTGIVGLSQDALKEIPLGEGRLPDPKSGNLEFVIGNMIRQNFYNSKTKKGFWDTSEMPDVDLFNKPFFTIFNNVGDGENAAPKKYIFPACGMVEDKIDDNGNPVYNEYSYSIYTDVELLKNQLRRIYKKKAIPGQPVNKKGKPYSYFVYENAYVFVDDMDHVMEVQTAITDMGYQAYSSMQWLEQAQEQMNMIQAVLGGIGAVSLFVAAIGIANTMMMSIYERTKEIGVLKVLGCALGDIRTMFLLEAGFIGFMGGTAGLALSYGVSALINKFLSSGVMGIEGGNGISRIPLWLAGMSLVFAVAIGMLAGLFPALRAMKLSPLAAIRNE